MEVVMRKFIKIKKTKVAKLNRNNNHKHSVKRKHLD